MTDNDQILFFFYFIPFYPITREIPKRKRPPCKPIRGIGDLQNFRQPNETAEESEGRNQHLNNKITRTNMNIFSKTVNPNYPQPPKNQRTSQTKSHKQTTPSNQKPPTQKESKTNQYMTLTNQKP